MTNPDDAPGPTLIRLGETDWTVPVYEEDIRGRKVFDRDGQKLGKVADLLVDDEAKQVRLIVVEHGGLLGIGAKETYVPTDAMVRIGAAEVVVDTDLEAVAEAPQYDPAIELKAKYYGRLYEYFGYPPFWTPELPSTIAQHRDEDRHR